MRAIALVLALALGASSSPKPKLKAWSTPRAFAMAPIGRGVRVTVYAHVENGGADYHCPRVTWRLSSGGEYVRGSSWQQETCEPWDQSTPDQRSDGARIPPAVFSLGPGEWTVDIVVDGANKKRLADAVVVRIS